MWWRRSWFSLKGKAGIPGQTEGRPATSIGPRVPPVGSLQQRGARGDILDVRLGCQTAVIAGSDTLSVRFFDKDSLARFDSSFPEIEAGFDRCKF
jgi:hypothetical protein